MSTTNSALHVFLKAYRSFFTLPRWQMFSTILFMRNKDQYSVNSCTSQYRPSSSRQNIIGNAPCIFCNSGLNMASGRLSHILMDCG